MTVTADEARRAVAEIGAGFARERSSLIPLMQHTQQTFGYLPSVAMEEIAAHAKVAPVDVWGAATFYNQFRLLPPGKYPIRVCMGTACHLAGGKLVLRALERELDINVGNITMDGNFSLERVACIGCCMLAPVVTIQDRVYAKMSPFRVEEELIPYKQEVEKQQAGQEEGPEKKSG